MPSLVHTDSFMVCMDCYSAILTGDYTHLDYYYNESEADDLEKIIKDGESRLADGGNLHDGEERDAFSRESCDCCERTEHGERREIRRLAWENN